MGFSKENQLWLEFMSGESGMRWCVKRTSEKQKCVDGLAVCFVTRKCSPDECPENHWRVLVEEETYAQHHLTVQFTDMRSCSGVVCIFIVNCATFLLFWVIPKMLAVLFLLAFIGYCWFVLFNWLFGDPCHADPCLNPCVNGSFICFYNHDDIYYFDDYN